jgi:hypothetical protein
MLEEFLQSLSNQTISFQFGDKRIDRRANYMIKKMAKTAGKSIPQIFCTEADLKGAYRFFDNTLVSPEKILEPHVAETILRCKKQKTVLAIQDSSDLCFDYMECLEGFESMQSHVEKGFRIHPVLAITEKGTPLGVLASLNYTRDPTKETAKNRNSLLIEEKESYRWLQGYREACKLAEKIPEAEIISISDREGDIWECLTEATDATLNKPKAHILIRARHNRCLKDEKKDTDKLEKKLIRCPVAYSAQVLLSKYRKSARTANIVIRASTVLLKAPATCKKKSLSPIEINAILVTETDPPKGVEPLHWLIMTTLPVDTPEEILRIVELYSQRWSIEVFFKVLKSGCQINATRFQSTENIENYIALAMLVGWKVMLTTYLPREYPDAPCTILFTGVEWRLAFKRIYKDKPFPELPTLKEAVSFVAMLGGYQKRKEPPGIQTIWEGILRLMDMVYGYELTQEVILSSKLEEDNMSIKRCVQL